MNFHFFDVLFEFMFLDVQVEPLCEGLLDTNLRPPFLNSMHAWTSLFGASPAVGLLTICLLSLGTFLLPHWCN